MTGDNIIQYCIPECTKVQFLILPHERYISVTLLTGLAKLKMKDTSVSLSVLQEYPLPVWPCLNPVLKSKTGCSFIMRGNHYVHRATTKVEHTRKDLFSVSKRDHSFVFILEKETQLQTFVSESVTNSDVSLESIRGAPVVFGYPLLPGKKYPLQPCSSVLVKSCDNKPCTVAIYGKSRRIKVSMIVEKTWKQAEELHSFLNIQRLKAIRASDFGPIILVLGPRNVGKTSMCHFLLNRAIDDKMNPIYIDLNVDRNSNTIPGAISLVQIENRKELDTSFTYRYKTVLQFGQSKVERNVQLYKLIMQRMSGLFLDYQDYASKRHSGAIIDMCGTLAMDITAVLSIVEQFLVDFVVVIGDGDYYKSLKMSVLRAIKSVFIPRPPNIESRRETLENKIAANDLRKYFYSGLDIHPNEFIFEAKFTDFELYKIVIAPSHHFSANSNNNYSIIPVKCEPSIRFCILGVSYCKNSTVDLSIAEIDYFVSFVKINVESETVTVLAPCMDSFTKKKLLVGGLKIASSYFENV